MRIGILGSADVAQALGGGFAERGDQVMLSSRDPGRPQLQVWAARHGDGARIGTFTEAAEFAELVVLATFARRYAGKIGKRLRELGAPYGRLEREPLELIQAAGYRLKTQESIIARAVGFGLLSFPGWVLATVLRSLRDGYTIASFEPS